MKILQIINNLNIAGAEVLVSNLAVHLKQMDIQIEVATLFETKDHALIDHLYRNNIPLHQQNFKSRIDPRISIKLRRLIKKGEFDIVHAHLFPALYYTALCKSVSKRMFVTEHSSSNHRRTRPFLRPFEEFIYGRYNRIVCISNAVKQSVNDWMPGVADKTITVYNGIDFHRLDESKAYTKAELNIPDHCPVVIMVSRIVAPQKDYLTLVKGIALINDVHLLIVGEGKGEPMIRDAVNDLGISERVHFFGKRNDVGSLMKTSDIYVQSSTYEGFCLAVVEAMACGIPIIVSDIPGIREIIEAETMALLFPVGNELALANGITRLLKDKEKVNSMTATARERSLKFTIENYARNLLNLYKSELQEDYSN